MRSKEFYLSAVILLFILLCSACSKRNYPSGGGNETVFYPDPPDTARIQFLARYNHSRDFTGSQNKFKTFVAGEEKAFPMVRPYGISIAAGKLYIADAGIRGIEVFDFDKNTFDYFIPKGRGKLMLPINCFTDSNGDFYVSDVERRQVVVFDGNMEYKGEIGGDENFKPTDAVLSGDTLFVTDPKNHRVNAYDKNTRQLVFSFPKESAEGKEGWLYNPVNLCVEGGKIYVTDFGDSRIKIFSPEGEYISAVGSYGKGLGQFVRPKGIAVDREQNLFAVDAAFENVQIFNKEGQLLMFFGGPYKGPGSMFLPANIIVDYDHLRYYEKYVDPAYRLKYLLFVTNQQGPDKVSVYGRIELK